MPPKNWQIMRFAKPERDWGRSSSKQIPSCEPESDDAADAAYQTVSRHFFSKVSTMRDFHTKLSSRSRPRGTISRRRWQADGSLNELAYFRYVESIF